MRFEIFIFGFEISTDIVVERLRFAHHLLPIIVAQPMVRIIALDAVMGGEVVLLSGFRWRQIAHKFTYLPVAAQTAMRCHWCNIVFLWVVAHLQTYVQYASGKPRIKSQLFGQKTCAESQA